MKRQLLLTLFALSLTLVSYITYLPDMETVVSASVPVITTKPALETQALTTAEVEARQYKPLGQPLTTYTNEAYRLNYPSGWQVVKVSANVVKFQATDSRAQVLVQALESTDDLAALVTRHVGRDNEVTRQSLQVNGGAAERVLTPSANHEPTVRFFIQVDHLVYLVSGTADRLTLETVAQSLQ